MKIFKYPLILGEHQTVVLPVGAVILDIQRQGESYQLWAGVDPDETKRQTWCVQVVGTGNDFDADVLNRRVFHKTTQDGRWVWHWFVY